jgi:hypothetical protein
MSAKLPDMSRAAVTQRLQRASEMSDLSWERRLDAKLDMSAPGITARLREAAQLLELCRRLERAGGNRG